VSAPGESCASSGPRTDGARTDGAARRALAGTVVAVCAGPGGIPKQPLASARVSFDGLEGDRHRSRFHGGANRAVCLFSIEDYRSLQRDRVVCEPPGAFGENVLVEGLDFSRLRAGDELAIGDEVRVAIHDVREPCGTLKSVDKRFPDLMLGRSGFVCRVVTPGILRPGMSIRLGSERL
jgi:MOSC domain-containing protein YiiM